MNLSWILCILMIPVSLFAQLESQIDYGGYIEKMNNTLNLRFDLDNDVRAYEFNTSNDTYSILPNTRLKMAIAYNYRFLSLRVGFSPKFLAAGDSQQKGKTSVFRLTLDMFIKDVYQTLEYNRVKGYYVSGFDSSIPFLQPTNGEFILLPGLTTVSVTGSTMYRFNENYSFKATVNQNEIQTRTAGSFVPGLQYGYWQIKDSDGPQDIESFYVSATAGYYQTFVLSEHWYTNLGISTGLGVEFNKVDTRLASVETTERNTTAIFNINTQIGLGYNSRRFYAGTALIGNAVTRDENSIINFDNVRGYFKVFVGYRFDPPKALVQAMDWLEKRNPFQSKNP